MQKSLGAHILYAFLRVFFLFFFVKDAKLTFQPTNFVFLFKTCSEAVAHPPSFSVFLSPFCALNFGKYNVSPTTDSRIHKSDKKKS